MNSKTGAMPRLRVLHPVIYRYKVEMRKADAVIGVYYMTEAVIYDGFLGGI
jgi:hypothetical protein